MQADLRPDGSIVAYRLRTPPVVGESIFVAEDLLSPSSSYEIGQYGVVREVRYDPYYNMWVPR